jgi:hypothetical protein
MPKTLYKWRIFFIKTAPATPLGTVEAPDEKTAIEIAIDEFEIAGPEAQKKNLIARRQS